MKNQFDFANILFAGPCSARCPFCIGRQIDPRLNQPNLSRYPLKNIGRFATLLKRHAIRELVITGTTTDPQLYHHEARLLAWLKASLPAPQISLHTNGHMALRKMDTFNQYQRVTISFPSFEPEVYRLLMGVNRMPNLAEIMRRATIPVKISVVLTRHNAARIDDFLARLQTIGVKRVVFRRLWGDTTDWRLVFAHLRPQGTYRGNPVYDVGGMEVTYWQFESTTSRSLNLFSDGTISADYLLAKTTAAAKQPDPSRFYRSAPRAISTSSAR